MVPAEMALDCPRCCKAAVEAGRTPERGTVFDRCAICGMRRSEVIEARKLGPAMTPEQVDAVKWREVESSQISRIGRHEGALLICFGGGTLYTYADVPEEIYETLVEADRDPELSVGKTFNELVKKGGFEYARVAIREADEEGRDDARDGRSTGDGGGPRGVRRDA